MDAIKRKGNNVRMPIKGKKAKNIYMTKEDEFRLIHEVRMRPILWDISLKEYSRSDLKPAVWDEIGSILGFPNEGEAIQHRFKNMRDTFMSNQRKIKESRRSGNCSDDVYVPKWHLFNELEFLGKSCAQATSQSNISMDYVTATQDHLNSSMMNVKNPHDGEFDDNLPIEVITFGSEESSYEREQNNLPFEMVTECNTFGEFIPQRPASAPSASSVSHGMKGRHGENELYQKRGQGKKNGVSLMAEAINVLKEVSQQPLPEIPKQDSVDMFVSFVGSRLRALDDRERIVTENKILRILMDD